jgi:hypothetical protein
MEDRRFGCVVICTDMEREGVVSWHLATRQVFKTAGEAQTYADTIAPSRTPLVVNGRWFEMRWATVGTDNPPAPPANEKIKKGMA